MYRDLERNHGVKPSEKPSRLFLVLALILALWIFDLLFTYRTRKGIAEAGQNSPISVSLSDLFVLTQCYCSARVVH